MKCGDARKMIEDGNEREDALLSHIKECAECSDYYGLMTRMKKAFDFKVPELDDRFNAGVWAKIETEQRKAAEKKPLPKLFWVPVSVLVAAGLAIAAIVVIKPAKQATIIKIGNEPIPPTASIQTARQPAPAEKKQAEVTQIQRKTAPVREISTPVTMLNTKQAQAKQVQNNIQQQAANAKDLSPRPDEYASGKGAAPSQSANAVANLAIITPVLEQNGQKPPANPTPIPKVLSVQVMVKKNVINPAKNEAVEIDYKVDTASPIRMEVYDHDGNPVKLLVNTTSEPGDYAIIWKGDNDDGEPLGAGIYIIGIQTALKQRTVKVLIIR